MTTSKSSHTPAKSGDRKKGIDFFSSMITLEKAKGDQCDTLLIRRYEAVIKCLEQRIRDEKKK